MVRGAHGIPDPFGGFLKQDVPDWMAQGIIDLFEVIDIEDQDHQFSALADEELSLTLEGLLEAAAVIKFGQGVQKGHSLEAEVCFP